MELWVVAAATLSLPKLDQLVDTSYDTPQVMSSNLLGGEFQVWG